MLKKCSGYRRYGRLFARAALNARTLVPEHGCSHVSPLQQAKKDKKSWQEESDERKYDEDLRDIELRMQRIEKSLSARPVSRPRSARSSASRKAFKSKHRNPACHSS